MLARADTTGNSLQIEQWCSPQGQRKGKLGKMRTQEFLLSSLYFDILSENREERTRTEDILELPGSFYFLGVCLSCVRSEGSCEEQVLYCHLVGARGQTQAASTN